MKALILAAGRGSRMGELTKDKPKGLVGLSGKPIIERMISSLKAANIRDIALITGYKSEAFDYLDLQSFHNPEWANTNMVFSLTCASEWLAKFPVVICYSDIFVDPDILKRLVNKKGDLLVAFDRNWQSLWEARFEDIFYDAESFKIDGEKIIDIGRRVQTIEEIQGQYMGILKTTPNGWLGLRSKIKLLDNDEFRNISVTELLQKSIKLGDHIVGVPSEELWGEIDTPEDLNIYEDFAKQGKYQKWF